MGQSDSPAPVDFGDGSVVRHADVTYGETLTGDGTRETRFRLGANTSVGATQRLLFPLALTNDSTVTSSGTAVFQFLLATDATLLIREGDLFLPAIHFENFTNNDIITADGVVSVHRVSGDGAPAEIVSFTTTFRDTLEEPNNRDDSQTGSRIANYSPGLYEVRFEWTGTARFESSLASGQSPSPWDVVLQPRFNLTFDIRDYGPLSCGLGAPAPIRQADAMPAGVRYIPDAYDAFLQGARDQFQATTGSEPDCPTTDTCGTPTNPPLSEACICRLEDGSSAYTIAAKGCELTCYAMALVRLGLDTSATPESVHDALVASGSSTFTKIRGVSGFAPSGTPRLRGGDPKIAKASEALGIEVGLVVSSDPELREKLQDAFDACYPVMLRTGNAGTTRCHHWVMAFDQRQTGAGWEYFVVDPGSSQAANNGWRRVELCQVASLSPSPVRVIRPREALPPSDPEVGFQWFQGEVNSPVRVRITDPLDRQIEVDATGFTSSEIPGAAVEVTLPFGPPDHPLSEGELAAASVEPPYYFVFDDVINGEYEVELLGTGDGDFEVDFRWRNVDGETSGFALAGTISTGQSIIQNIEVGPTCEPDLNGDAQADLLDLLLYLGFWFEEDPAAERTGDRPESINVLDLVAFLGGWFDGCP